MRQKQVGSTKVVTTKALGAKKASVKLGPKDPSTTVFTGSPAVTARKSTSPAKISKQKTSHPGLQTTQNSSKRKSGKPEENRRESKRHYRPGTKALREIRKYQKGTDLLLSRAPFQRLVRELTNDMTDSTTRFTADALECLQTASEAFIVQMFEDSVLAMIHAKRVTLLVRDVQFIRRLRGI